MDNKIKEIVKQFNETDKKAEFKDGLIIHNKMNLPFISELRF